jgi:hypothetical protein
VPKKNDPVIDQPPADTEADATAIPTQTTRKRGRPEDRSITSDEWGAVGPNGEPPNMRLRHTPEGSFDRQMHSRDHGDYYPARRWVKNGVKYLLPTKEDGTPDVELQRAGFWSRDAHRITTFADYALIK